MSYRHTLLHLTDVHAVADGALYDSVDSVAALRAALDVAVAAGGSIDAIVLSGDITDQGDEASYRIVRDIVGEAARRLGAVVVAGMGNHDERGALRSGLLGVEPSEEPYDDTVRVDGLRIITLDSTVPGAHHGDLDDDQLAWLADELAEPAPHGTVLTLHHPPIASTQPLMGPILLRRPERLAEVVKGTDVRLLLCGHTHAATMGTLAGIPVWVGPANAYAADPLTPEETVRALPVRAFTRVDLTPDQAMATLVPLTQGTPVYEVPTAELAERLAAGR
jgi:3',5'-cyclic AMP phosphodiesterase CpdA